MLTYCEATNETITTALTESVVQVFTIVQYKMYETELKIKEQEKIFKKHGR